MPELRSQPPLTTRKYSEVCPARAGWDATQTDTWWETWLGVPGRTFVEAVCMLYTVDAVCVHELPRWYSQEVHGHIRHFLVDVPDGWLLVHLSERAIAETFGSESVGDTARVAIMAVVEKGTVRRSTLLALVDLLCAIHVRLTDVQRKATLVMTREPDPISDHKGLALFVLSFWWNREHTSGLDVASARMLLGFCDSPLTGVLAEHVIGTGQPDNTEAPATSC